MYDVDYFVKCRIDGSYDAEDALRDYLETRPEVAYSLAIDLPDVPFDYATLQDNIRNYWNPWNAFLLACNSDFDPDARWFCFDGDQLVSLDYEPSDDCFIDAVMDNLADDIIGGRVDIPSDLKDVLALWGPNGLKLCEQYMSSNPIESHNIRKKGARFRWA